MSKAVLGIIGGSGVYDIAGLEDAHWRHIGTPWGKPSDDLLFGRIAGVDVVFLPRHGRGHVHSPTTINYRANIDALKRAGCTDVISVSACGSLREDLPPGHFVLADQFIDRTHSREKTFFGDGFVAHVSLAHPVCPRLVAALAEAAQEESIPYRKGGTYLAMEGPQFSTLAESNLYRSWGCDVIGMTAMPEAKLAREAELPYAIVAMVTDYDCWHPDHDHVTVDQVDAGAVRKCGQGEGADSACHSETRAGAHTLAAWDRACAGHRPDHGAGKARSGPVRKTGCRRGARAEEVLNGMYFTIGHSTRSLDEFAGLLISAGVRALADVRRIPRSATNPQFNLGSIESPLAAAGIAYRHIPELGGLRARPKQQAESPNSFWENKSFRNYADYAATEPFRTGFSILRSMGRTQNCAIMCAEAVWWRCHRRIIADYLLASGEPVSHILGAGKVEPAKLTPAARAQPDGTLIYPAVPPEILNHLLPLTCVGSISNSTRTSPGLANGYLSLPRYFFAILSMCSAAPCFGDVRNFAANLNIAVRIVRIGDRNRNR